MKPPKPPIRVRRRWYHRTGLAIFVWALESLIGLIPYLAHEASVILAAPASHAPIESVLPELCVLSVVASALALLSLLRDWFIGEARKASALTVTLAVANIFALLAGGFLYPIVDNKLLTDGYQSVPADILAASLAASFLLATERGFSSAR